ncbi:MAG TPA: Crp/Fnr family transcriptional regulator [Xanthobacteraceae bacterium]|nr:Crp/Fnr family transcriptional regulator [Xanthobacteraceae bacterium]
MLLATNTEITRAYFPDSSLISLIVVLGGGGTVEVGMIGRDGVAGASAALGAPLALNDAVVQVPGVAEVIDIRHLKSAAERSGSMHASLFMYCHFKRALAQQSAACLANHSAKARLCRWLLRMQDLTGLDDVPITQEFLARMLGVRRVSVTMIADRLQRGGLIRYRRGHIEIRDRSALEHSACECYQAINEQSAMLLEGESLSDPSRRAVRHVHK